MHWLTYISPPLQLPALPATILISLSPTLIARDSHRILRILGAKGRRDQQVRGLTHWFGS
jgi:hypothetical protein